MAVQKIPCRVAEVAVHGDHVYTVTLRPDFQAPRFRPGQFLHLALDDYEPGGFWPESRVFSIASSPARRDLLRVTYSARGRFTARMERELAPGGRVWVKMPYGDFVIDGTGDIVLFAGGTGITAFVAFLEQLVPEAGRTVTLAYGARNERLLVYRDLVERGSRSGSLSALYFVEDTHDTQGVDNVIGGRISVDTVWARLARPDTARYFISGPPPMLTAVTDQLRARHVAATSIHTDAWE